MFTRLFILMLFSIPLPAHAQTETAIFAGGCFWCVESDFDKIPGVTKTVSGYIGGHKENPAYKEVSAGLTGHTEAVEVTYDNTIVNYKQLIDYFWKTIDPTVKDRQFCDRGSQYRSEVFYRSEEQKKMAEQSKREITRSKPFKNPIVTEITKATTFYPAEEYHQDYYQKNPLRYKFYRFNCGRDKRLETLWNRQ